MYDSIKLLIRDVYYDITSLVSYPINENTDISKVLDTASFAIPLCKSDSISGIDLSEPIKPLTKVELAINGDTIRYLVREDECSVIGYSQPLYSHKLSLIEPTVILEKRPVPDFTITQPKGDVTVASSQLNLDDAEKELYDTAFEQIYGIKLEGDIENTYTLLNTTEPTNTSRIDGLILRVAGAEYTISTTIILNTEARTADEEFNIRIYANDEVIKPETVVIPGIVGAQGEIQSGRFDISVVYTTSIANEEVYFTIEPTDFFSRSYLIEHPVTIINKFEDANSPITYLDEVIDKAISIQRIRDVRDTTSENEFTLEENTRNAISAIVAPEDTYTASTLWDICEDTADLVKAIPRVGKNTWNEISFDFVNDNLEEWENENESRDVRSLNLEKWTDSLEINADNVIESIEGQSIKVEPYENGWMTLRSNSEGPNQLTDTTLGLKLRSNIYRMNTVLAKGFTVTYSDASSDGPTTVWDISDRILEEKEWNAKLNTAYNTSTDRFLLNLGKGNTLYYKKNDRRLLNFGYRAPRTSTSEVIPDLAIYEVIAAVAQYETGKVVTSVTQDFETVLLESQYRIYYIPFNTIRAKLYKHNAREYETISTLFSNERAKVNDSIKLGEYNQSLVNRSGNKTRKISGLTKNYLQIPSTKNIVGNEVVTNVNLTINNGLYEYDATLFNNYTEISNFVGIKSEFRQYQVPDDEIIERNDIYEDFITVSRTLGTPTHSIITSEGWTNLLNGLVGDSTEYITYCKMTSIGDEEIISENPVDVQSMGCTTLVMTRVKDNYSVDNNTEEKVDGDDGFVNNTGNKVYQNDFNYTDRYGQVETVLYDFYTYGKTDNTVADGNIYPEYSQVPDGDMMSSIRLNIKKDAREILLYTHQLNFFSGLNNGVEDLRVYNGISKFNGWALQELDADIVPVLLYGDYFPSVEETKIKSSLYLETVFDTKSITVLDDYAYIDFTIDVLSGATWNGYAFIDKNTNELIYAVKQELDDLVEYTDRIYFYPDESKGL